MLVFKSLFVLPEHQIVVYFFTERGYYKLGCLQLYAILNAVFVGHYKIGQFLRNFIQFLALVVHLFQHLSVVRHVVVYRVINVRDLTDVVFSLFVVVQVFLQFVPSSVNQHERLALWFQFVLEFDILRIYVVAFCGTRLLR